jgi:hypothetical protein
VRGFLDGLPGPRLEDPPVYASKKVKFEGVSFWLVPLPSGGTPSSLKTDFDFHFVATTAPTYEATELYCRFEQVVEQEYS